MSADGLSLVQLLESLLLEESQPVLARLAELGCPVWCPEEWRPLAGRREYRECTAGRVEVDGVPSTLTVEMARETDKPESALVNGLRLEPVDSAAAWEDRIREVLRRGFDPPIVGPGGVATYRHVASVECMLFPDDSEIGLVVLMHRRSETRTPDHQHLPSSE